MSMRLRRTLMPENSDGNLQSAICNLQSTDRLSAIFVLETERFDNDLTVGQAQREAIIARHNVFDHEVAKLVE